MFIKSGLRQRGVTLIELIVFMVIVSTALAGVLTVMNITTMASADPLIRKQMLTIAEALLEEVQSQRFTWCDPDDPAAASATQTADCANPEIIGPETVGSVTDTRMSNTQPFDNVSDYALAGGGTLSGNTYGLGDPSNAIQNITGNAVAPLGYTASVQVTESSLNSITATESLLITVTVSKGSESLTLEGYRTRYAPTSLP
jgi:MSHA pilin protein MshD